MTTPSKLNEFNHAEDPAWRLLERLGWTYAPRDALAAERGGEREMLLSGGCQRGCYNPGVLKPVRRPAYNGEMRRQNWVKRRSLLRHSRGH